MFKSLALIAAVAAADITLTGSQDEKTIAAFGMGASGDAALYKVTCASKSGYKLDTTFVTAWAQNTGSMTTTKAKTQDDDDFDSPKTDFTGQGWWLNVALQGAMTSAKGQTYNMHMLNNAVSPYAYYASQAVLDATAMKGIVPVAEDNGAVVSNGGNASAKGTVIAEAVTGNWVVVKAKSLSTVAPAAKFTASMTLTLEKKITTDFAKWTRKESMTMGCGGGYGATNGATKEGKIDTTEWEFGTAAGAVATMAGASVVAAAALLF